MGLKKLIFWLQSNSAPSGVPVPAASAVQVSNDCARYLAVVVATIAAVTVAYIVGLRLLDLVHRKPPPAFSNSLCVDAKLEFLRKNPPVQPTHLIVGSSISWRNIAGAMIAEHHPEARPLNAGFCGLRMNQTAYVSRFFLARYPTITDVLLLLDPLDMSACRRFKSEVFDESDAGAYLSGANDLKFYFKYFDLVALLRNAISLKEQRASTAQLEPLVFNRYADGPLEPPQSRGLLYGPPERLDPTCRRALSDMATDVTQGGRRLVVVTMPLLPQWSAKYDARSKVRDRLANQIRTALADADTDTASFWDAWSTISLPATDYVDAVHLRWSAARRFTKKLVAATGFGEQDL